MLKGLYSVQPALAAFENYWTRCYPKVTFWYLPCEISRTDLVLLVPPFRVVRPAAEAARTVTGFKKQLKEGGLFQK